MLIDGLFSSLNQPESVTKVMKLCFSSISIVFSNIRSGNEKNKDDKKWGKDNISFTKMQSIQLHALMLYWHKLLDLLNKEANEL